jgi:hypothetical protein
MTVDRFNTGVTVITLSVMLKTLKNRLLGDSRTETAVRKLQQLYKQADNPEAFNEALKEGDIERAAGELEGMDTEDLYGQLDELRSLGEDLGEEYDEIENYDKEEFIDA